MRWWIRAAVTVAVAAALACAAGCNLLRRSEQIPTAPAPAPGVDPSGISVTALPVYRLIANPALIDAPSRLLVLHVRVATTLDRPMTVASQDASLVLPGGGRAIVFDRGRAMELVRRTTLADANLNYLRNGDTYRPGGVDEMQQSQLSWMVMSNMLFEGAFTSGPGVQGYVVVDTLTPMASLQDSAFELTVYRLSDSQPAVARYNFPAGVAVAAAAAAPAPAPTATALPVAAAVEAPATTPAVAAGTPAIAVEAPAAEPPAGPEGALARVATAMAAYETPPAPVVATPTAVPAAPTPIAAAVEVTAVPVEPTPLPVEATAVPVAATAPAVEPTPVVATAVATAAVSTDTPAIAAEAPAPTPIPGADGAIERVATAVAALYKTPPPLLDATPAESPAAASEATATAREASAPPPTETPQL